MGLRVRLARLCVPLALLAVAVAFLPGLGGELIWDDEQLVAHNAHVQRPTWDLLRRPFWDVSAGGEYASTGYYRPVVSLAYAGEFALFGARPLGYKVVSLLLHLACAGLAIGWVRRRTTARREGPDDGRGDEGALAAAIAVGVLFVHPTRVESVTWISGCTDLWMTFWALAGVALWQSGGAWRRGAAAVALLLSMLSKEVGVVVPVLLVTDALLLRAPGPARTREVRAAGVLALAGAGAFALRLAAFPPQAASGTRLQAAVAALGRYAESTFWPARPSFLLGAHDLEAHPVLYAWLGAAVTLALVALAAAAVRGPRARGVLADALWLVVPLLPVLGLLGVTIPFAERFLYLPLLGLAAVLARCLGAAPTPGLRLASRAGAAAAYLAYAGIALVHGAALGDDAGLWTHELEELPEDTRALENLAKVRLNEARYPEALELAQRGHARSVEPGVRLDFLLLSARSLLLGTQEGDRASLEALRGFYDSLALGTGPIALSVRGFSLQQARDAALEDALRARPLEVGVPRAMTYRRTGQLVEAERQVRALLARWPGRAALHDELARILLSQGRKPEARASADAGLAIAPGTPSLLELRDAASR